ncbi:uncharacterized protein LOC109727281 [Ananas comosus]|uniref:Uncharacterized protein LOC109727281 n=1 Tax=Ananas comosus TaxID=4615 RepID=A0A6P5GYQ3_ANACO|nr:uncharacterized protein LOC109727281 [Ananas comosus]
MRFPSSRPPIEGDTSILRAPRPRPSSTFLHLLLRLHRSLPEGEIYPSRIAGGRRSHRRQGPRRVITPRSFSTPSSSSNSSSISSSAPSAPASEFLKLCLAISTALASAAADALVVEDFEDQFAGGPKTKDFVAAMRRWGLDPKQKDGGGIEDEVG